MSLAGIKWPNDDYNKREAEREPETHREEQVAYTHRYIFMWPQNKGKV